ncbi:PREDICTED: torsin-1A-interacting protein 2 [Nanorana parkeri]|uniref:torsin-1A-interacting protein 2 n=1 Tax=Nanorana parkeri TaxID=125878 RepID=UPI0008548B8E|nr:PREDICTED: torsin-1A-interacting protein 2 [Nanorana parkeri]
MERQKILSRSNQEESRDLKEPRVHPEPALQESPEAARQESPEAARQESPEAARQESPEAARQESPEAARQESPEAARQESPEAARQESPEAARQESPEAARQESPEAARQESPEAARQESPEAARQESPEAARQKMLESRGQSKADQKDQGEDLEPAQQERPESRGHDSRADLKEQKDDLMVDMVLSREEGPGAARKEGPGAARKEDPGAARKEGLEAARKEGPEAARKEGPEAARKEDPGAARKEGLEAARKEGPEAARKEGLEVARKEGPEAARKEDPEPTQTEIQRPEPTVVNIGILGNMTISIVTADSQVLTLSVSIRPNLVMPTAFWIDSTAFVAESVFGGGAAAVVVLIAIGLGLYFPQFHGTQTSDARSALQIFQDQFKSLQKDFPKQSRDLWLRSEKMLRNHLNKSEPREPATIILTAAQDAKHTLLCLGSGLAQAYAAAHSARWLVIHGPSESEYNDSTAKLHIDEKLSSGFQTEYRAAVLNRLETLPPGSLLILYKYCDHENAAYKNVALVLTVLLEDSSLEPDISLPELEEKVRDFLWQQFISPSTLRSHMEMDSDKLGGVWSRISHLVLPVVPVESIEVGKCPFDHEGN